MLSTPGVRSLTSLLTNFVLSLIPFTASSLLIVKHAADHRTLAFSPSDMNGSKILDVAFTLGNSSVPRSLTRVLRLHTLGAILTLFAFFITCAWITSSMTFDNDIICQPSPPHLLYNTFLTPSLCCAFGRAHRRRPTAYPTTLISPFQHYPPLRVYGQWLRGLRATDHYNGRREFPRPPRWGYLDRS